MCCVFSGGGKNVNRIVFRLPATMLRVRLVIHEKCEKNIISVRQETNPMQNKNR